MELPGMSGLSVESLACIFGFLKPAKWITIRNENPQWRTAIDLLLSIHLRVLTKKNMVSKKSRYNQDENKAEFSMSLCAALAQKSYGLNSIDLSDAIYLGVSDVIRIGTFCPNLKTLDLSGNRSGVTDISVKKIGDGCRVLQNINFSGCNKLTDNGLKYVFEKCAELEIIDVRKIGQLTSRCFESIGKKVREIYIGGDGPCLITDQSLALLAVRAPDLTTLQLENCWKLRTLTLLQGFENLSSLGFYYDMSCYKYRELWERKAAPNVNLSRLRKLEKLRICRLSLPPNGFQKFFHKDLQLRELDISHADLGDGWQACVNTWTHLTALDMSYTQVTDEILWEIDEVCGARLKHLRIRGCWSLVDPDFEQMFQNLSLLDFGEFGSGRAMNSVDISSLSYLEKVYLTNNKNLTTYSLDQLFMKCELLSVLHLDLVDKLQDSWLTNIGLCSNLVDLSLRQTTVSDVGLGYLCSTEVVRHSDSITRRGTPMPCLRRLGLRECLGIQDTGMSGIITSCLSLREVDIRGTGISIQFLSLIAEQNVIQRLKNEKTKLKLKISGTKLHRELKAADSVWKHPHPYLILK